MGNLLELFCCYFVCAACTRSVLTRYYYGNYGKRSVKYKTVCQVSNLSCKLFYSIVLIADMNGYIKTVYLAQQYHCRTVVCVFLPLSAQFFIFI